MYIFDVTTEVIGQNSSPICLLVDHQILIKTRFQASGIPVTYNKHRLKEFFNCQFDCRKYKFA